MPIFIEDKIKESLKDINVSKGFYLVEFNYGDITVSEVEYEKPKRQTDFEEEVRLL